MSIEYVRFFIVLWIERLNKDFRGVSKMRGNLPTIEKRVILLFVCIAMDEKAYDTKSIKFDGRDLNIKKYALKKKKYFL